MESSIDIKVYSKVKAKSDGIGIVIEVYKTIFIVYFPNADENRYRTLSKSNIKSGEISLINQ